MDVPQQSNADTGKADQIGEAPDQSAELKALKDENLRLESENGHLKRLMEIVKENIPQKDLSPGEINLSEKEKRLRFMIENLPAGVIYAKEGLIFFNHAIEEVTGYNRSEITTIDQWFDKVFPDKTREFYRNIYEQDKGAGFPYRRLVEICRKDGEMRWVAFMGYIDGFGEVSIMTDLTNQKKQEEKYQEQEKFIQKVADASSSLIYLFDLNKQKNLYTNEQLGKMLGYSQEEITEIGPDLIPSLVHPDDLEKVALHMAEMSICPENTIHKLEYRIKHKSGNYIWLESRDSIFLRDEKDMPLQIVGTATDITASKRMESDRMAALIQGQESERKRVSEELHDGLGLVLSIAKQNLMELEKALVPGKEAMQYFDNTLGHLQKAVDEVRNISKNLLPPVLSDFGLVKALQKLCDGFRQTEGIAVRFETYGIRGRLEKKTELALYRITQELLNNALKYSGATTAKIQLKKHSKKIVLRVTNNGKPFNAEDMKNYGSPGGLGLSNISARVDSLEGNFSIKSPEGTGPDFTVVIPVS